MVAMPRIPTRTITATTIKITLRALLPPVGAGAGAVDGMPAVAAPAATAAPHLLQNFVPGFRVAPQELQNAISHLVSAVGKIDGASIPQIGNIEQGLRRRFPCLAKEARYRAPFPFPCCAGRTAEAAVPT